MNKKEEFKVFASRHPELVHHVKTGEMSWQKFYEIYDIYGENDEAWRDYFSKPVESATTGNFSDFTDKLKNIDMNSIQEHIKTAQKALNLVSELTSKGAENVSSIKGPITPRPLNKFFED
jgi:hypothetical protein